MILKINSSYIYSEIDIYYVNIYLNYIIDIIKFIIIKNNLFINVIIGNTNYNFNNSNKIIRININWEHTLVKKNGRGVSFDCKEGNVLVNSNEYYLVRLDKKEELENCDIIIDYSIPNIYNIFNSNLSKIFIDKMVYISPSLLEYNFKNYTKENRKINVLTTFININEERRKRLIDSIKSNGIEHTNINNCFENEQIQNLYLNTKVLINIHQTEHHHTFEELRVLPALLSGVLVICELSPLNTFIPYNDLIIWSSYDNIIELTKTILNNYDFYHDKIFKQKNILSNLHNNNITKLENQLLI